MDTSSFTFRLKNEERNCHIGGITCFLDIPDMEMFVTAGNDKRLCVWDSVDGKIKKTVKTEFSEYIKEPKPVFISLHQRGKDEGFCQVWKLPGLEKMDRYDFGPLGPFSLDENSEVLRLVISYITKFSLDESFRKTTKPQLKFHNNYFNVTEDDYMLILNKEMFNMEECYSNVMFLKTRLEEGLLAATTQYGDELDNEGDNENDKNGTLKLMFMRNMNDGHSDTVKDGGIICELIGHKGKILSMCSYLRKGSKEMITNKELEHTGKLGLKEVIITGGLDKRIFFWDTGFMGSLNGSDNVDRMYDPDSRQKSEMFNSYEDATIKCDFVQTALLEWDDTKFLSGDTNGTISLWDIKLKKVVYSLPQSHSSAVSCLMWISKNRFISGGYDGSLKIFGVVDSGMLALRDERERLDYLLDKFVDSRKFEIKIQNVTLSTNLILFCL